MNYYQKPNRAKAFLLPIVVIGVVVGAVVFGVLLSNQEDSATGVILGNKIEDGDHQLGNTAATLELVEYGDFQCSACAAYEPMIKQLMQENGDWIKFAYRHLPLKEIHKNATKASYASEAAHIQGKFWEYKDLLYQNQGQWSNLPDPMPVFVSLAEQLSLNVDQFVRDVESDAVKTKVDSDYRTAQSLGLNSTPTFFVNGEKIANQPTYDKFVELLRSKDK